MAEKWVCSIVTLLFTAHLMLPGVLGEECAPVNHDIKALKKRHYWEFEIQDKEVPRCPELEMEGTNTSCIFYFSICEKVPSYCPAGSGICLAKKVSPLKYPNITLYTRFIDIGTASEVFDSGGNDFTLTFSSSESATTLFTFKCDESAEWKDHLEDGKVNQYLVNATYHLDGIKIQYNFVFNYSGACGHGGGGGGGDEGPKDVLSVGSILLIVFFPGIFLYCVVGALINKGSGKTGKDMIPNAKFWSNLPGLISDGFSFVISKITCSEMSTTQERYDRM
ncbi:unnamed protein product [Porites lobata]|uniref:Autophagy-related protein 27 n=1 Tax=Porites lobata TaxID=104759 RepID=A0ABN8PJK0_9CNID|nr:unnamed protein product [Porites lobata]